MTLTTQERDLLRNKLLKNSLFNSQTKCLEWLGGKGAKGYGCINFKKKSFLTHRAMWIAYRGYIPDKKLIKHTCKNPLCITIEHMFLGTSSENISELIKQGKWGRPQKKHPVYFYKQMAFYVHPSIHEQVKELSAKRNISMNLWIQRAINDRIMKERRIEPTMPKE